MEAPFAAGPAAVGQTTPESAGDETKTDDASVAIRFFHDDGWVGAFAGNRLAETFPDFDVLTAFR